MATLVKGKQLSEQDVICTNSATSILVAGEETLKSYLNEVSY